MNDKKTFGDYLTQKRKEAGFTQKAFADRLFITESAVSKWERGLSYPDITLIRDICGLLGVSEHELLTSSEDIQARNDEKLAKKYLRLIARYKYTLFFLYGISLLICLICNIAVQRTVSWFFIVLAAEMTAASLTLLPVLMEKRRGLITLGSFTLSLLLLLLICSLYSGGGWFPVAGISVVFGLTIVFLPIIANHIWLPEPVRNQKAVLCFSVDTVLLLLLLFITDLSERGGWFLTAALPIAAVSLTLPWGIMLILRYARINGFFKTAACLAAAGIFVYFFQGFPETVLGIGPYHAGFQFDFSNWSKPNINDNVNAILFFTLLAASVLFAAAGIFAAVRHSKAEKSI